jgi:uncharacterized membrane protein
MLFVHFAVGYGLTGSWQFGSALALIDLVLGVLIYYYHDRFWSLKVMFGKEKDPDYARTMYDIEEDPECICGQLIGTAETCKCGCGQCCE